jgi:hypothetical protein
MYPQLPNILHMLANFSLPLEPSRFILPAYFNIYAFTSFVFHCPLYYVHGVVSFFHTATFKWLQERGHYSSNAKSASIMLLIIICANLKFSVPKQISLSTPPLNPALPPQTNDTLTIQTSSKAHQLLHQCLRRSWQ